jgi:hypothetical protein
VITARRERGHFLFEVCSPLSSPFSCFSPLFYFLLSISLFLVFSSSQPQLESIQNQSILSHNHNLTRYSQHQSLMLPEADGVMGLTITAEAANVKEPHLNTRKWGVISLG